MGYPGWMGTVVLLKSFAAFQGTDLNLMSAELIFDQPGFGMSFLQRQCNPGSLHPLLTFQLPRHHHRSFLAPLHGRNGSNYTDFAKYLV